MKKCASMHTWGRVGDNQENAKIWWGHLEVNFSSTTARKAEIYIKAFWHSRDSSFYNHGSSEVEWNHGCTSKNIKGKTFENLLFHTTGSDTWRFTWKVPDFNICCFGDVGIDKNFNLPWKKKTSKLNFKYLKIPRNVLIFLNIWFHKNMWSYSTFL